MFQVGERLMLDQCTNCHCSLQRGLSMKYKLTCGKITCEPCPQVSGNAIIQDLPDCESMQSYGHLTHCMQPDLSLLRSLFPFPKVFLKKGKVWSYIFLHLCQRSHPNDVIKPQFRKAFNSWLSSGSQVCYDGYFGLFADPDFQSLVAGSALSPEVPYSFICPHSSWRLSQTSPAAELFWQKFQTLFQIPA